MFGEPEHGSVRFSRRSLLRRAVGAIGILSATLNPALAQPKISKVAVNYQDHPDGDKRCDKCIRMRARWLMAPSVHRDLAAFSCRAIPEARRGAWHDPKPTGW